MGVSRRGYREWVIQRLTAVVLAGYTLFLLGYFCVHPHLDYVAWKTLYATAFMQIITMAVLLSLAWHTWIGIWTVCTDYIHPFALRILVLFIVLLALALYFFWGIAILWSI